MNFVEEMKKKAKEFQNSLVLPEGTEERTVQAAAKIVQEKLAKSVTLLGKKEEVEKVAASLGISRGHHVSPALRLAMSCEGAPPMQNQRP